MRDATRWMLIFLLCLSGVAIGQNTNSGDIRGTVTDSTGALLPGVTITVLNIDTGVSKDYTSDSAGLYDTSSIVVGSYKITFQMNGFDRLVRGPVTLQVGVTTVNAQLTVGSVAQQVTVSADVPLLRTESGEQSTTLDAKTMSQLPQTGQDWENFTIMLPGAAGTNSFGNSTNPGQVAAVNGNLPYNSVLADGASTTLPSSANSDISIFETVSELQINTSSFSAQYGIGGVIFNQISKGGTNSYHGAAYEYFQNDALNAANYGFGTKVVVPFLRYNNFGGSVGGPILRKKMFFYFNFDKIVQNSGSNNGFTTLPTPAMMAGDFTGLPTIYDPTTQVVQQTGTQIVNGTTQTCPCVTRTSFAQEYGNGNKIPAALLDPVAQKIQAYYPNPTTHPATGKFVPGTLINGVDTNNYYYSIPAPNPYTKYFGRLDYDINSNNRLTMSDTQRDNPAHYPGIYACPVGCESGDVDSNNAQVSDVWNISARTINEARFGYTDQWNFFGAASTGEGYPAKLGLQFSKADIFPTVNINGQNCCASNNGLGPATNAVYKEMAFDPSDVVTMIRGKHVLHFGGELLFYRDDTTTWGNINGATLTYTGAYTQSTVGDSTTGVGYADFLLGQTQSWSASVSPEYGARLKSPQVFVQDDIKMKPNFTLNLGVRYQIQHGWNEVKNNISVFDPTVINPATNTLGAMWYASTHANGRTSLQANIFSTVLPRVGFSLVANRNTTVRGGFGLYAYNYSLDETGTGMGSALSSQGSLSDQTNGISPVVILSSNGSTLPYTLPTTNPAALNGQGVNYNRYHTPLGKSMQWNLAVQREIGTDMVGEVAYVASHGYNLAFPINLNQVPEAKLGPNDSPNDLPYPQFQGIGGSNGSLNSVSNYDSLQISISKRFTSGVAFNFNYVWSHFMDDEDSSGWGSRGGTQVWQRAYAPSANYGASNFDVRDALKGNVVYALPIGRGKRFLNGNALVDAAIGGWQTSGVIILSTGNPFTPTVSGTDNSFSQGGQSGNGYAWYPNQIGDPTLSNRTLNQWFNPAAFTIASAGTFGDMKRNNIYGPGINLVNLSASKTFSIWEDVKFQIRGDATNAFNHPSFSLPNSSLVCSTPGTPCTSTANITGVSQGGRTMQLGARLSF
jgi:Carboxypeptidase regulatory-like domain